MVLKSNNEKKQNLKILLYYPNEVNNENIDKWDQC